MQCSPTQHGPGLAQDGPVWPSIAQQGSPESGTAHFQPSPFPAWHSPARPSTDHFQPSMLAAQCSPVQLSPRVSDPGCHRSSQLRGSSTVPPPPQLQPWGAAQGHSSALSGESQLRGAALPRTAVGGPPRRLQSPSQPLGGPGAIKHGAARSKRALRAGVCLVAMQLRAPMGQLRGSHRGSLVVLDNIPTRPPTSPCVTRQDMGSCQPLTLKPAQPTLEQGRSGPHTGQQDGLTMGTVPPDLQGDGGQPGRQGRAGARIGSSEWCQA